MGLLGKVFGNNKKKEALNNSQSLKDSDHDNG